ncbi:MAG TPA: APC family permease [Pyrinomonadaceae bacterium]|nr:APC family permease [Pyrinomonadaceae bacterium]
MTKVSADTSEAELVRGIRRWDLVAIAINGIIGAGIFGLPAKVFSLIGPYSLIAFVVCAAVVTLFILCFAEVGSRFDETGGPYLYAREAFAPTIAFEIGWLIWLARLTAFAANCNLLVAYLGYFLPAAANPFWRAAIIIVVVLVLATINVVGIRQAAIVSNIFTVGKLVPLIVFVAVGLFFLNSHAFAFAARPTGGAFSQSVLLLVYAFTGFEMASIPAGEVRDPRKNLPHALLIAIAVVACLYILVQIVCVGTLPELAQSQRPLADASTQFMGTAGGAIISAGAMVSIIGNLNVLILSGSRIPFAIAEQRQLPSFIALVHRRFATPYVAILITASIMLLLTLKSSFVAALTISTIARLVTYGATCISLPLFRRRSDVSPAAFHLPFGTIISISGLLLAAWLLANSTWQEARATVIAAAVGFGIYLVYRWLGKAGSSRRSET